MNRACCGYAGVHPSYDPHPNGMRALIPRTFHTLRGAQPGAGAAAGRNLASLVGR